MMVRPEADQRARSGANRSGSASMHGDDPRGNAELDDHHSVQRADQQHDRHADRHLEERQAQKARHRQFRRRRVRERQEARPEALEPFNDGGAGDVHGRKTSRASEM